MSKIPADMAEQEFEKFAEAMDIDINVERMDDEDAKDFEGLKNKIVGAIMKGSLVISDNGEPVLSLSDGESLTFSEPTGASLMATDKRKKTENVARLSVIMAEMCGVPVQVFAKMPMRDFKVCQSITTLFLG